MKNSRNLKNSSYISSLLCFPFFISKMTEEGLLQALKMEPHTCNFSFRASPPTSFSLKAVSHFSPTLFSIKTSLPTQARPRFPPRALSPPSNCRAC